MNTWIRRYHQLKIMLLLPLFKALSCLQKKKPWVLHERCVDARDNAYFFYRYLKEKHPEQKIYFIIDKKSADYPKVAEAAVHYGSLKNYWVMATGEKIISTHCYMGLPGINPKLFRWLKLNEKFYFLQHGVTQNDIEALHFDHTGAQLFACGAKPEYDYVCKEFGYPQGAVQYTGFARYDTLRDAKTKNQILIMPTWRMYIETEKQFQDSGYYAQWNKLLTDPRLAAFLEKNDLSAIFYPHFEAQPYLRYFRAASPRITLADFANYDVQTLLKESKLLVTDYSSVFFDFAYMRKPVVYFQFDQEDFFSKHYNRGYFSFSEMGFGPVAEAVAGVIEAVEQSADNGFNPQKLYADRIDTFFPLYDQENCERIYQCITNT